MSEVIVFAGPCLPPRPEGAWAELLARVETRPPAQRGSVLEALAENPTTLVLLDGYYYSVSAVTHQEILYALDAGVRVIGAASMGALRAAELAESGMEGVGRVFEWYRRGVIDGDDEVAILHGPAEEAYRAMTVALVDVRYALESLELTGEPARQLVDELAVLPFTDREPERVATLARTHLGAPDAAVLERTLARDSLKRQDALQALERAFEPAPRRVPARRRVTVFLNRFREESTYLTAAGDAPASKLVDAWGTAQLLHPGVPAFVEGLRRRDLLGAAALVAGVEPDRDRVAELIEELRGRLADGDEPTWHACGPEIAEEAEARARAERARQHFGGEARALAALADHYGLQGDPEELLLELAESSRSPPRWWQARAFALTAVLVPARELAACAAEIHGCFERWARGRRVVEADLLELAAELWGCRPELVEREARRRGIEGDHLRPLLERHAAAERLPRAINGYPETRRRLRESSFIPAPRVTAGPNADPRSRSPR